MKKITLFLSLFIITTLACDLSVTVASPTSTAALSTNTTLPASSETAQIPASATPLAATSAPTIMPSVVPATATRVPATTAPIPTTIEVRPPAGGVEVGVDPLRVFLSSELASGARGIQIPRADGPNTAPWDVTPGHTQLKLEGYLLQARAHQPQIYVYPAQGYAEMMPGAFESIHRLNNIQGNPGAPIRSDQLPGVPFFNAQQAFSSNIQVISFQNGRGVRFLTEYAQYPVSANNHDLFYHFQGVTNDGAYYVIAILPISSPALAETSDGGAVLPGGGVAYPDINDPNANWQAYYSAVTALLNAASPESFTPTIHQLDLLIQSMLVTP